MITATTPLRFAHHALAVLGAATIVATFFSLVWTAALAVAADGVVPGMTWLATMALLCWLGVFIVALPGAGMMLSLLWPVTRRGTPAAHIICLLAGFTLGVIVAPLASPDLHGATALQLAVFALTGAAVSACYLLIANRLSGADHAGATSVRPMV